ncbi:Folylpolyglutamate synthetase [Beauveria brongniartii RCEF 3172]|uniref:tetrahydrofolate synthase n=1 Tax=Beauveria brongniartii RCEF 3172 TaxID=1081107 RepID=A0A167YRI3_9HYPO|nr:Folylpolyglutamate synthetase [Beauveria brongniartii RCEF 3172]
MRPTCLNDLNVIHIAGSKGKGSTAALTASMLSQFLDAKLAPTKIGVFVSPHVRTIRERIRIIAGPVAEGNDWLISEEQFAKYVIEVWNMLQQHHSSGAIVQLPSFFLFLLAVAIHAFASDCVDTVILECGIGGEFDATNMVDRPLVSAITTLELEHTDILGTSLESIAWHKSGIMRRGVPIFTIPQHVEAQTELERRAEEKGAVLTVVDSPATEADVTAGAWHALNVALARRLALTLLTRLRGDSGMSHSEIESRLGTGARQKGLPGRFEIRHAGTSSWYIDGAHTLQSVAKAAEWFSACTRARRAHARILLYNQEGRETTHMLSLLHSRLDGDGAGLTHVLMSSNSPFTTNSFSAETQSMLRKLDPHGEKRNYQEKNAAIWASLCGDTRPKIYTFATLREAVEYVRTEFLIIGARVDCLATGSLHLVGGLGLVLDELCKNLSSEIGIPTCSAKR